MKAHSDQFLICQSQRRLSAFLRIFTAICGIVSALLIPTASAQVTATPNSSANASTTNFDKKHTEVEQQVDAEQNAESYPVFKLSGFATLGASYNSSRQFDYVRDLLQSDGVGKRKQLDFGLDSLFGLQATGRWSEQLETTIQAVLHRGEKDLQTDLTWAFVKYRPQDDIDLRFGRLGFDVYPLADSRNVAYSYTWIRPPVEYFGELIVSYIDGADAVFQYAHGNNQAKVKAYAGNARERMLAAPPDLFFSINGSHIWGGHLEYQSQSWLGRIGYSELKFNNEFPSLRGLLTTLQLPQVVLLSPNAPALANNLSFKEKKIQYLSAGVVYDEGPMQAQFMLGRLKSHTLGFNSNLTAFVTLAYRVNSWTPYFTTAKVRPLYSAAPVTGLSLGVSPLIGQLETRVQNYLKSTRNDQHSVSLGLKYSINQQSDIRVQIDKLHNRGTFIVRNASPDWNGKATIVGVSCNFIF
jgi:hypothetical protein